MKKIYVCKIFFKLDSSDNGDDILDDLIFFIEKNNMQFGGALTPAKSIQGIIQLDTSKKNIAEKKYQSILDFFEKNKFKDRYISKFFLD